MADFTALKTAIQTYIKQNGNEEITGNILQEVLLAMVQTMGDGAINDLVTALSNEVTARQNADGTLQNNITAEATARGNADTALGGRLTTVEGAITAINTKLAEGYVYAGIANSSTNPGTPSGKVFYFAPTAGTYTNFGGLVCTEGITILKYDGANWTQEKISYMDGGVFDVTAYSGNEFASLSALLSDANLNTLIPTAVRKGGMSIKFVESSDNKYVQYFLNAQSFTTDVTKWQGVDDNLVAGSNNIAKSGTVHKVTGFDETLSVSVSQGVALNEVIPFNIPSGYDVSLRLEPTQLIDNNGVNVLFYNNTTLVYRTEVRSSNFTEVSLNSNIDSINIERSASGVIGTGNIDILLLSGIHEDVAKNKQDIVALQSGLTEVQGKVGEEPTSFNVAAILGEALNTNTSVSLESGDYFVKMYQNNSLDNNGASLFFKKGSTTKLTQSVHNGQIVSINLSSDIDSITVDRSASGVLSSGNINFIIYKAGALGEIDDNKNEIDFIKNDIEIIGKGRDFSIPVAANTALNTPVRISLQKSKVYYLKLVSTDKINNNGVSLSFRNGSTVILSTSVRNGGTIKFQLSSDTDRVIVDKDASGISGTGFISFYIEEDGIIHQLDKVLVTDRCCYVATNGNDINDGVVNAPFATINKALDEGFSTILVKDGTYNQEVDLSHAKTDNVKILAVPNALVTFYPDANDVIKISSETKTDGYTNVYQASVAEIPEYLIWIFQDLVNDESTAIPEAERHPLQRNVSYRLDSTKIIKCTSETLSDALDEIDGADVYKYFYDSTNHVMYFSRPQTASSSKPIIIPKKDISFIKVNDDANQGIKFEMLGINVRYMSITLRHMISPRVTYCSAKYANCWGGIYWSGSNNVYLEKCESAATQYNTNGDGFNADHGGGNKAKAHNSSCLLVDCWSHDNHDDGYSCHQRCEGIIMGGLFEYNVKGGVTPAYGEKHECYNVLSRKNVRGILYTGAEANDKGSVVCFNCVVENNSYAGFCVSGANNKMTCYNCKSIGDDYGYRAESNTLMELVDCGALNNTTAQKYEGGTITIKNTQAVV